jgi:hypothetical protein
MKNSNQELKIPDRKGGRVVDCIGFENRRNFTVTEGSNPSLSVKVKIKDFLVFLALA